MSSEVLLTGKTNTLFFRYLGATVFANLTHALYVIVDLLCVGIGVGGDGLAAMNIALPIFTVYTSIALCIGVGGAATMSLMIGKGQKDQVGSIFTLASWMVIIQGILLGVLGTVYVEPLARFLGASDEIMDLVRTYLIPVNITCVFFMYSHMLQVFLRNDQNPKLAMKASVFGSALNIILDIVLIFIFDMGIFGAALPTAISPLLVVLIMLRHFKRADCTLVWCKKCFNVKLMNSIIRNGLGVFLLEMTAGVSIFIFNTVLMKAYGMMSVSVYAVMANIVYVGKSMYNGIAQAAQPIISINEGAGFKERAIKVTNTACMTGLILGSLSYLFICLFPSQVMGIFTTDQALIEYGSPYLKDYFLCLVFAGVNTVLMYYFQSTERPRLSILASLCKGLIFIIIGLVLLMPTYRLQGVYMTTAFGEAMTLGVIGAIYGYICICNNRRSSVQSYSNEFNQPLKR